MPSATLTSRFSEALEYATSAHAAQLRKGTDLPYISHLLSVAALVLDDGGSETEAMAALLHDVVEDQGGAPRLADVRDRFGDEVAAIVEGCTDYDPDGERDAWRPRKQRYIHHVGDMDPTVRRVSLADKLHNARAILRDYRVVGEELWTRFSTGSGADQLWYLRGLTAAFREAADRAAADGAAPSPMLADLEQTVDELERRMGARA